MSPGTLGGWNPQGWPLSTQYGAQTPWPVNGKPLCVLLGGAWSLSADTEIPACSGSLGVEIPQDNDVHISDASHISAWSYHLTASSRDWQKAL